MNIEKYFKYFSSDIEEMEKIRKKYNSEIRMLHSNQCKLAINKPRYWSMSHFVNSIWHVALQRNPCVKINRKIGEIVNRCQIIFG